MNASDPVTTRALRGFQELASLLDAIARTSTDDASRDLAGIGARLARQSEEDVIAAAARRDSEGRA